MPKEHYYIYDRQNGKKLNERFVLREYGISEINICFSKALFFKTIFSCLNTIPLLNNSSSKVLLKEQKTYLLLSFLRQQKQVLIFTFFLCCNLLEQSTKYDM